MGGRITHLMHGAERGMNRTSTRRYCLIPKSHAAYSSQRQAAGVVYRREKAAERARGVALRAAQTERSARAQAWRERVAREGPPPINPQNHRAREQRRRLLEAQAWLNADAETDAIEAAARGQPNPPRSVFPGPSPRWAAGERHRPPQELLEPVTRPVPRSDFRRSYAAQDREREQRDRQIARERATLAEERANDRALSDFRSRLSNAQISAGIDRDIPAECIAAHQRMFGWRHSRGDR